MSPARSSWRDAAAGLLYPFKEKKEKEKREPDNQLRGATLDAVPCRALEAIPLLLKICNLLTLRSKGELEMIGPDDDVLISASIHPG